MTRRDTSTKDLKMIGRSSPTGEYLIVAYTGRENVVQLEF